MYLLKSEIVKIYNDAGIGRGSHIIVQSSYKGMGIEVEGKARGLVEALLDVVGPEGSVIMGAYNHTVWTQQHYFDRLETPADIGIVPELFRQHPASRRTRHPVHSLSVSGALQDELCALEYKDSFGADSVWAALLKHKVICTNIGLGTEMGFIPCHHTETMEKVPYRRYKNFAGIYLDENGEPSMRTYGFHVRKDLSRPAEPYIEAHNVLVDRGEVNFMKYRTVRFYWRDNKEYHEAFAGIIREMPGLFM